MIAALKARKFDGVLSSMSVTDKRLAQIAFSDPGATQETCARTYWEPKGVIVRTCQTPTTEQTELQLGAQRLDRQFAKPAVAFVVVEGFVPVDGDLHAGHLHRQIVDGELIVLVEELRNAAR